VVPLDDASTLPEDQRRLLDEIKSDLGAVDGVTVGARGDQVVITLTAGALFDDREGEPGLGGYRVLYRLGKRLKGLRDRQITVSADAAERRKLHRGRFPTTWHLTAARAVSVARFLVDDAGIDPRHVSVSAPAPGLGRGRDSLEIVLSPAPAGAAAGRSS